jgi:orotidine-5'-phosphate decarboxylase
VRLAGEPGEGPAPSDASALPAERAAAAVIERCRRLIESAGPACVAAKPQLACFERLGAPGWAALEEVCVAAREAGLLTIADGKRGDVPVTAAAYAQALVGETPTPWGPVAGLGVDAFTANPLLGRDAMEPLVEAAANAGAGVFALVRTSNPGAADILDLPAPKRPLHERLATLVGALSERLEGESGLSGMGAVVGATEPEHIAKLRALMPRAIFLMPGVGAQGGRPETLGAAFAAGPASGLVPASRGIAADPDPAAAAERLRSTVWEISTA